MPGLGAAPGSSVVLGSGAAPGFGVAPQLETRAFRARDAFAFRIPLAADAFRILLATGLAAPPQDQALRPARRPVALNGADRAEGIPEETTRGFGGVSAGR